MMDIYGAVIRGGPFISKPISWRDYMWIYTKTAFVSIVMDRDHPDRLLIRGRIEGDIQRLWPQAEVEFTPDHDYAYRAVLPRRLVAHRLAEEIKEIGYANYKDAAAVQDHRRSPFYLSIWAIAADMQDALTT